MTLKLVARSDLFIPEVEACNQRLFGRPAQLPVPLPSTVWILPAVTRSGQIQYSYLDELFSLFLEVNLEFPATRSLCRPFDKCSYLVQRVAYFDSDISLTSSFTIYDLSGALFNSRWRTTWTNTNMMATRTRMLA